MLKHKNTAKPIGRSLGKGLNALLGEKVLALDILEKPEGDLLKSGLKILELDLGELKPGVYQPRRDAANKEIQSLADSIRTQGMVQPIIVRKSNKSYEIIAGERRFHAAKMAGLKKVPVIVKDVDNTSALIIGLIENLQRENLNPVEEALALDRLSKEFKYTHQQVAEALGKSRTTVTNSLRLLNLHFEVKNLLEKGELEVGHAKILLGLNVEAQYEWAKKIIEAGYSVRELEKLLGATESSLNQRDEKTLGSLKKKTKPLDPDIRKLQNVLSEKLGAKVSIQHRPTGKGCLAIIYNNLDELDGILEHFQIGS
ncbi:MAG: ParB/RepB/Spo0J family partition protein [Gammaproteobacteria bacterium]